MNATESPKFSIPLRSGLLSPPPLRWNCPAHDASQLFVAARKYRVVTMKEAQKISEVLPPAKEDNQDRRTRRESDRLDAFGVYNGFATTMFGQFHVVATQMVRL